MKNLTFEEKVLLLAATPPGPKKRELIQKFASTDVDFFKAYNRGSIPLDQYMQIHAEEFKAVAIEVKLMRDNMRNKGWNHSKTQKLWCQLPQRLIEERPEFSSTLPNKVLHKNIHEFLLKYPQFKI